MAIFQPVTLSSFSGFVKKFHHNLVQKEILNKAQKRKKWKEKYYFLRMWHGFIIASNTFECKHVSSFYFSIGHLIRNYSSIKEKWKNTVQRYSIITVKRIPRKISFYLIDWIYQNNLTQNIIINLTSNN